MIPALIAALIGGTLYILLILDVRKRARIRRRHQGLHTLRRIYSQKEL